MPQRSSLRLQKFQTFHCLKSESVKFLRCLTIQMLILSLSRKLILVMESRDHIVWFERPSGSFGTAKQAETICHQFEANKNERHCFSGNDNGCYTGQQN